VVLRGGKLRHHLFLTASRAASCRIFWNRDDDNGEDGGCGTDSAPRIASPSPTGTTIKFSGLIKLCSKHVKNPKFE
jgi:hypothetical protein